MSFADGIRVPLRRLGVTRERPVADATEKSPHTGSPNDDASSRVATDRFNGIERLALCALIILGVIRVVATYSTFTQTFDEPFHVACGMEWLDRHTYTYEYQHPPLTRIAVALGPYLNGARSHGLETPTDEGNAILLSNGNYGANLWLARAGNLPFFVLGAVMVVLWAKRWFGAPTALWSLVVYISLPPILGHAGIATTDMGCAATFLSAMYFLIRWWEQPSKRTAAVAGVALALAICAKFSNVLFLALCCAAAAVQWAVVTRMRKPRAPASFTPWLKQAGLALIVAIAVMWTLYRFQSASIAPVATQPDAMRARVAAMIPRVTLPLGQLVRGLLSVVSHNRSGHDAYLLGKFSLAGWWYFFPVVLAVKTPILVLLSAVAGCLLVGRRFRRASWQQRLAVLCPVLILAVSIPSHINIGVRHVLPMYPFMAILAGYALSTLYHAGKRGAATAVLALAAIALESFVAHPDYLAYTNQIAGASPERILVESDVDWGQDLHRLSVRLKQLGVRHVAIRYNGTFPLEQADLPEYSAIPLDRPVTGYVAISVRALVVEKARIQGYSWLSAYSPIERIGKSILLYRIPEPASSRSL